MAVTAVGAIQQAQAATAQGNYQAQVADNNSKLATQQAQSNANTGAQEAQLVLERARQVKGQQAVAFSANGLDIGAGSPLDVLSGTERMGQLDKANTQFNSAQNTWALQNQANDYTNQASGYRSAAKNNAMTSLLTGASQMAGQYSGYQTTGAMGKKKVNQ